MYEMLLRTEVHVFWCMMQCQLVYRVFGWICCLHFRSKLSKKRWRWRQHAPLNGDCVLFGTSSYPRRLGIFNTALRISKSCVTQHSSSLFLFANQSICARTHALFQMEKHNSPSGFTHCTLLGHACLIGQCHTCWLISPPVVLISVWSIPLCCYNICMIHTAVLLQYLYDPYHCATTIFSRL
jgi:hypothetical protein